MAAINCIATLGVHCTEDVLYVLCNEFLNGSNENDDVQTTESENRTIEQRMKVGDVIVKVTRGLGMVKDIK